MTTVARCNLVAGSHPLDRMLHAALQRANRSLKKRFVARWKGRRLSSWRAFVVVRARCRSCRTWRRCSDSSEPFTASSFRSQVCKALTQPHDKPDFPARASRSHFYNTLFGLSVATVTVVGYLLVSGKQGRELVRMEHATSTLVDELLIAQDKKAK